MFCKFAASCRLRGLFITRRTLNTDCSPAPVLRLPKGPPIKPQTLAGTYRDPDGGKVHLTVDGTTFSLRHSIFGPLEEAGRIDTSQIVLGSHYGTYDGRQITWDNGVVAPKLSNEILAASTLPLSPVKFHGPVRPLWIHGTLPLMLREPTRLPPIQELRSFAAWLSIEFKVPHIRKRTSIELASALLDMLEEEGMLVSSAQNIPKDETGEDAPTYVANLFASAQFPITNPEGSALWSEMFVGFPARVAMFANALKNINRILPIEPAGVLEELCCCHDCDDVREATNGLRAWSSIHQTKSLFVHGLGSFDVAFTYKTHFLDTIFFPTPWHLQAHGYAPRLFANVDDYDLHMCNNIDNLGKLFQKGPHDFRLRYFIRHREWFNNEVGINRLDEVLQLVEDELPPGYGLDTPPGTLLDAVLDASFHQAIPFEKFAWLDGLADLSTEHGTVGPVRDTRELQDVARELKNCAATYADDVRTMECMLVVLRSSIDGLALALGEFRGEKWLQLVEKCNKPARSEIRGLFESLLPEFRDWWRTQKR